MHTFVKESMSNVPFLIVLLFGGPLLFDGLVSPSLLVLLSNVNLSLNHIMIT